MYHITYMCWYIPTDGWNGISHEGLLPGGVYGKGILYLTPTQTQVCKSSYTDPYYVYNTISLFLVYAEGMGLTLHRADSVYMGGVTEENA